MNPDSLEKYSCLYIRFLEMVPRILMIWCMFFIFMLHSLLPCPAFAQSAHVVRVGFSSSIFENVNKNDVMTAIRVWAMAFVKEHNIQVNTQPLVLTGINEIREALSSNALDYINLTVDEFVEVNELLAFDTVILGVVSNSITEEYLLVVPKASGIETVDDLKNRSLNILTGARASLAEIWMDTLLLRERLGTTGEYLGDIKSNNVVSKVLLPVFFGKNDACVVTRSGFETMAELNPQIEQKLRVIAVSPPFVPTVFCFTLSIDESVRKKVSEGITKWHSTHEGKQCLTIFRTDRIEEHPISVLKTSLELVAEHKQLLDKTDRNDGEELADGEY